MGWLQLYESVSKKDAISIVREIDTGRGGIARLVQAKPKLISMSQEQLRASHGDNVPLFRAIGLPENKEFRDESIVSTTLNWKVAFNMTKSHPGMIMTKNNFISVDNVLIRYDVPIDDVLADVNMLLNMALQSLGGPEGIANKTIIGRRTHERESVLNLIDAGLREFEVIADVSNIKPTAVLSFGPHVGGRKEMEMVDGIDKKLYNTPEEYLQYRKNNSDYNEVIMPEEHEKLLSAFANNAERIRTFLGNKSETNIKN